MRRDIIGNAIGIGDRIAWAWRRSSLLGMRVGFVKDIIPGEYPDLDILVVQPQGRGQRRIRLTPRASLVRIGG